MCTAFLFMTIECSRKRAFYRLAAGTLDASAGLPSGSLIPLKEAEMHTSVRNDMRFLP